MDRQLYISVTPTVDISTGRRMLDSSSDVTISVGTTQFADDGSSGSFSV